MKTLNLIPALIFISLIGCTDKKISQLKITDPVPTTTTEEFNKNTVGVILPIDRLYPDFNTLNRRYLKKEDGC